MFGGGGEGGGTYWSFQAEAGAFQRGVTGDDGAAQPLDCCGVMPTLTQPLHRPEPQQEGLSSAYLRPALLRLIPLLQVLQAEHP